MRGQPCRHLFQVSSAGQKRKCCILNFVQGVPLQKGSEKPCLKKPFSNLTAETPFFPPPWSQKQEGEIRHSTTYANEELKKGTAEISCCSLRRTDGSQGDDCAPLIKILYALTMRESRVVKAVQCAPQHGASQGLHWNVSDQGPGHIYNVCVYIYLKHVFTRMKYIFIYVYIH